MTLFLRTMSIDTPFILCVEMYLVGQRFLFRKASKIVSHILIRGTKDYPKVSLVKDIRKQVNESYTEYKKLDEHNKPHPKTCSNMKRPTVVTVLGSNSRIGSTLALLLKVSPIVDFLNLHDDNPSSLGVGLDLSHIDTSCKVQAFVGNDSLEPAVKGANVVVVCAADERHANLSIEGMFHANAERVAEIAEICAKACPKATVAVMAQPVNCLVPLMHEIFHMENIENPRVLGIPTLNVVRATTMLSSVLGMDPQYITVPVMGGTCGDTLVPIFSQSKQQLEQMYLNGSSLLFQELVAAAYYPCRQHNPTQAAKKADQIDMVLQKSDEWILQEKGNIEGPTMGPAYSGARFILNLIRGMTEKPGKIMDIAYVRTKKVPGTKYCCVPVVFGVDGVILQCVPSSVSEFERKCLLEARDVLASQIRMGEKFAQQRMFKTTPFTYL